MIDQFENTIDTFNSHKEAYKAAESRIDQYKDDWGWPEESDMNGIMVAKVTNWCIQKNKQTKEEYLKENPNEEWFNDNWSYVCDYEMYPELKGVKL